MLEEKDKKLANRLIELTLDAGDNAVCEIVPALEGILKDWSSSRRHGFIRYYLRMLKRAFQRETLLIEHAGPLESSIIDSLKNQFSEGRKRDLRVEPHENPALIGGLTVQLGDNVYDASVNGRLQQLTQAVR